MTITKIIPILLGLTTIIVGGSAQFFPEKLVSGLANSLPGRVVGKLAQLPETLETKAIQAVESKLPLAGIEKLLQTVFGLIFGSKLPEIDTDMWWGDGERQNQDTSVREFSVAFDQTEIDNFKQGLINHRPFTKTLKGIQSQYGMNVDFFQKILDHLLKNYDFKKRQDLMNQYPRYKTNIQGLDMHFIHVKSEETDKTVLPILMVHGWPSHSEEFIKAIPRLTTPRDGVDIVFEVVAVDLPGFGFSEGTTKPGLDPVYMAVILKQLMERIGFSQFYIQAGDWGSQICSHLAVMYPDSVLGLHLNFAVSLRPITLAKMAIHALVPDLGDPVLAERTYPLLKQLLVMVRETGFMHLQATKPDTIGIALSDSPVGSLAYISEKYGVLSNRNQLDTEHGGLANLNIDEVIDMIVIMWMNNAITTSMRLYYEAFSNIKHLAFFNAEIKVPMCAVNFKYETLYQSKDMISDRYTNILRSTVYNHTGHFAAMENPDDLVQDIFDCIADVRKFINK